MSARSAGFDAVIDTLGDAQGNKARTGFWMLDGSDGPARLAFRSGRRRRNTAEAGRWLAIVRAGVFGAAGIVDAAQLSAARRRMSRQVRPRMAIDPRMWDLSASPAGGLASATRRGRRLTITASGVLRTLDLNAARRWL